VLQTQAVNFEPDTQLIFPSRNQLNITAPELRIDLAQFYQLADCPIQTLIAERNTTLGKLHSPSRRYLYEVDFIQILELCQPLPANVLKWLEYKQQQLPMAWARLVMLSDELQYQLSAQAGFIRGQDIDGLNQVKQALTYLLNLQQTPDSNSQQLEQALHTLLNYPLLSQIWRSQQLLAHNLERTNHWLKQQQITHTCVTAEKAPQEIIYLSNVFRLFFIQKIQPVSSRLNYYHYQLQPKIQQLLQAPALTPEFKTYIHTQYEQGFLRYQTQIQRHIQLWQQVFKQCQINFTQR